MLVKRILTALVGIPLSVLVVVQGGWLFVAAVAALALCAWHEWRGICNAAAIEIPQTAGFAFLLLLLGCAWQGNGRELYAITSFAALAVMSLAVLGRARYSLQTAAFSCLGAFYIGAGFSHLVLLRFLSGAVKVELFGSFVAAGAVYLGIAFLGIWSSDTMAFFVGRQWGRHKLSPSISPGKTVEGFLGGLLCCVALTIYLGQVWLGLSLFSAAGLGVLIGLTAPLGDLAESALKRFAGVKDSGTLFPGHGGVLDRFDSVLFAVPVVYYYIQAVGG